MFMPRRGDSRGDASAACKDEASSRPKSRASMPQKEGCEKEGAEEAAAGNS